MAKSTRTSGATPASGERDRIVAAFMGLMAENPPDAISFEAIAARAEVSLSVTRSHFGSRFDMIAAFVRGIDIQVLEGVDADLSGEATKERLFDILMRRLDLLSPHKAAIRNLAKAARRSPSLLMGLNRLAVRSHQWMLEAAGVSTAGPDGGLRAQAMAGLFAPVVEVWLDDEDPALARTMKTLDEALARAERGAKALNEVERLTAPLRAMMCPTPGARFWRRDRWREREGGERWRGDDFRNPDVTPV